MWRTSEFMKTTIRTFQSNPPSSPEPNLPLKAGLKIRLKARARRALAFTLIETVVASFLAAIMVPAIYASTAAGFAMVRVTRENMRATQILLQRMEAIRLSSYKLIQDPSSYPTNSTDYFCNNGTTNGAAYTVSYNWQPGPTSLPPSYRTNMLLVTVNASWTSGNVLRTRSMQTYVARYGIQRYVSSN
jgi:type II secretory pathway pseudopilin PulG